MNRLIECVPNFSEGRDLTKVDAIVAAMSGMPGAWILDRTSDADHNRSVITLAGDPDAVAAAVIRGAGAAAELIDLTQTIRRASAHRRDRRYSLHSARGCYGGRVRGARAPRGTGIVGALPHPGLLL